MNSIRSFLNLGVNRMTTNKKKILFICKKKNDRYGISYGLINSCLFVCNALSHFGIDCKVVQVNDNNCIDREVFNYKPTHVFIEALWVVPNKIRELINIPRYKNIKWSVRCHSKMPFIANEGIAIEWIREYLNISKEYPNFTVSANNIDLIDSSLLAFYGKVVYFPNIYAPPTYTDEPVKVKRKEFYDIGCFGAIRPMKNQLYQAMSAVAFGNELNKKIRFHINSSRLEQKGDPVLKNIQNVFANSRHSLVEHPWMNHENFIRVVKTLDMGLQTSFSESFNIVAADFVWNGIPLVGSHEIDWLNPLFKANPTNMGDITFKMYVAYRGSSINLHELNHVGLKRYNYKATKAWLDNL